MRREWWGALLSMGIASTVFAIVWTLDYHFNEHRSWTTSILKAAAFSFVLGGILVGFHFWEVRKDRRSGKERVSRPVLR